MTRLSYDRDAVRLLVALGGLWVSDQSYISVRHVPCQYERWPFGNPDYYQIGIDRSSLDGVRYYDQKWDDLAAEAATVRLHHGPDCDLRRLRPELVHDISELWTLHRSLESALDMVEAVLSFPTGFTREPEWIVELEYRLGVGQ